jgi:predicted RNA-binding Zn-ribbon protein involved in translation (DUF1610 family)
MILKETEEQFDEFWREEKDYMIYVCPNCHWEGYRIEMKPYLKIPFPGSDMVVEKLACPDCGLYSGVTRDSFV